MGQHLQRIDDDTAKELRRTERELGGLTKSKEWQAAKTAADLAGIADPTPTADTVSLVMSVAEGDWVGAFLSGVSFIPYAGDAVAKPIKLARTIKTIAKIEQRAAALAKQIAHYKSLAGQFARRKMAAAGERARRAKEAGERYAAAMKCKTCPKPSNRFGTQLPTTGSWKNKKGLPDERGHSRWSSEDGSVSVEYKEGYPDFTTSKPPSIYPKGDGKIEIEMKGDESDFITARDAMRDKLGDPNWPGKGLTAPEGYTWHHTEDGVTMQLVRSDVHDKARSGAAHMGGESIVSGKDNLKQDSQF
jgi:hypothetical protein